VRLVISDTGPINYLVLIGHIDILPVLFEKVIMPVAVLDELTDQDAPPSVQAWIASPPVWIEVEENPASSDDALLAQLDDGERAAITLAAALHAELLLMDDREGVIAARRRGLAVTGTIGILIPSSQIMKGVHQRMPEIISCYPLTVPSLLMCRKVTALMT
jgi:predicted nucleic acid-binding protein